MKTRLFILVAATAVLLAGSDKKVVGSARGENQDLTLEVTLYLDPASVKDLIGTELGGHFMLAAVKMEPKYGKQITIDRDDFLLRTDKDGEKATPFAPTEIAGGATLVVPQRRVAGGEGSPLYLGPAPNENGPAVLKNGDSAGDRTLEKVLTERVLAEKKTDQPASGLLYFSMEKQKLKDLELTYGARGEKENQISLRFKPR